MPSETVETFLLDFEREAKDLKKVKSVISLQEKCSRSFDARVRQKISSFTFGETDETCEAMTFS